MAKRTVFSLEEQSVKFINFNPRPELHGENPKPAADLTIKCTIGNDELALFHPSLKAMLYQREGTQAAPDDLVDKAKKDDPNHMPHLRIPKLGALKYGEEIIGANITIDYGVKNPIEISDCNVNDFRLDPKEGGSVEVGFRIQCHPTESQAGKLYSIMGNEITLTIEPPKATEELTAAQRKKRAKDDAHAQFES